MENHPHELYDDFDGEPLPENLVQRAFDENGNLRFTERIMLIVETIFTTAAPDPDSLNGIDELHQTLANQWSVSDRDRIIENLEALVPLWDRIDSIIDYRNEQP